MKVVYKLVSATLYVGLLGELDESCAAIARARLDEIFDECDMEKVVMDLSALGFMDSTGIGVLIGRYKKLKQLGVPLLLASPTKVVDKVLSLSGIYEIMPKVIY